MISPAGSSFRSRAMIDAVDADVEAERADRDIVQFLFAGLDGEGRALAGFVVEPGTEQVEQALAFGVEVGAGPAGSGAERSCRRGRRRWSG